MSNALYGYSYIGNSLFGGEGAPIAPSQIGIEATIADRSQGSSSPSRSADVRDIIRTMDASQPDLAHNNTYPDRTIGG